jgi:regulatory protein
VKRPPPSLKAQALALLARREQSRAELRTKLLAHARKLAAAAAAAEHAADEADPLLAFLDPQGAPGAHAASRDDPDPKALLAQVDEVLDWLAAQRHQSDARFLESRVHARSARQGQALIRQELARHGIELDADTARQLRETEFERAREVWRKRFGEPAPNAAERARQMRFLAARGFSADVVRRLVAGRDED